MLNLFKYKIFPKYRPALGYTKSQKCRPKIERKSMNIRLAIARILAPSVTWSWSIILAVLFSLFFLTFYFSSSVQAETATLKWTIDECTVKCDEIKKETLAQIEKQIEKITNNPPINDKSLGQAQAAKTQINKWDCAVNEADGLCECVAPPAAVTLQIPIGDTTIAVGLVSYIISFYTWGTRAAGFLAVILIMIAGLEWLTAAGDQGKIGKAKDRIQNSVIGLVLVLGAVFLLNLVNPVLTNLSGFQIKMVPTIIQQIYFCDNLPDGVVLTDKENKTVKKEDALCNEDYYYNPNNLSQGVNNPNIGVYVPPADTAKTAKTAVCKGRYCPPQALSSYYPQICGASLRQDILSCQDPEQICASYSQGLKCQEADDRYFKNTNYGCAKRDDPLITFNYILGMPKLPINPWANDQCVYGPVLNCPSGYTRVDCRASPECSDSEGPKNCTGQTLAVGEDRRFCLSPGEIRPIEGAHGICCQKDTSYQCVHKNEGTSLGSSLSMTPGEPQRYVINGVEQYASLELAQIIQCIDDKIAGEVAITSITDKQVDNDAVKINFCSRKFKDATTCESDTKADKCECKKESCCPDYCQHGCGSCHYGCGKPYSFAADLGGDRTALCNIVKAANDPHCKSLGIKAVLGPKDSPLSSDCGDYVHYSGHETHIHISTIECSCSKY